MREILGRLIIWWWRLQYNRGCTHIMRVSAGTRGQYQPEWKRR